MQVDDNRSVCFHILYTEYEVVTHCDNTILNNEKVDICILALTVQLMIQSTLNTFLFKGCVIFTRRDELGPVYVLLYCNSTMEQ